MYGAKQPMWWTSFLLVHLCCIYDVNAGHSYASHVKDHYVCCSRIADGGGNQGNWCGNSANGGAYTQNYLAWGGNRHDGWEHVICCSNLGQHGGGRGTWYVGDSNGNTANGYTFYKDGRWERWLGCQVCPVNQYSKWDQNHPWDGQFVCEKCEAGKQSVSTGSSECTSCPAGKISAAGGACTDCVAGKKASGVGNSVCGFCLDAYGEGYVSDPGSSKCTACLAGQKQTSASACSDCAAGTYNASPAQTQCSECVAGKSAADTASLLCASCDAGKAQKDKGKTTCNPCDAGTYKEAKGVNIACDKCVAGKFSGSSGLSECSNCDAGKSSAEQASECFPCMAGKYSTAGGQCQLCAWNTYSARGDAQCTSCLASEYSEPPNPCKSCMKGEYLNTLFKAMTPGQKQEEVGEPCLSCAACPPGSERVMCLQEFDSPGICMSCYAGKRLVHHTGSGLEFIPAMCDLCPENEYQEESTTIRVSQTTCTQCPRNSISPRGSTSLRKCECKQGFIEYPDKQTFVCGCEFGRYVVGTQCEECGACDPGYYRTGCGGENPGLCRQCHKPCTSGYTLAGCGGLREGSCKKTTDLVRTPLCPTNQGDVQGFSLRSAGFGFFHDFTSVFRASTAVLDFRCSDICDGTTAFDTVACDGPYACNMATCAEDVREEGNMIPVRACPVIITNEDNENTKQLKRRESCVRCEQCGHALFSEGSVRYSDWGAGCVRECSQLRCDSGDVWDWTRRRCSTCDALSDFRLCNKADTESMSLLQRTVTGNLPLLFFANCKGGGRNLLEIGYGSCTRCDENKEYVCTGQTYPAQCENGASVLCKVCSRTTQSLYVEVLQGRWIDSMRSHALHCQVSACKDRSGLQWTGVESSGKLCRKLCAPKVCTADEILIPCRLPHQARCEALFPAPVSVPSAMHTNTFHAGGEVNLLNEAKVPGSAEVDVSTYHRRVASFENIVMVLPSALEYQCVWNADGIIDNTATPGGISHVLWAPGQTADDLYRDRGTKACRQWDVQGDVEMPLLPLQNTVSCSAQEDTTSHCMDRYMLVNTEAYVLSYSFLGNFGVVGSEPSNINTHFTASGSGPEGRMLQGEHVGSTGSLFLMLRMHQKSARLAANVPNDRALHSAPWLRSLLVSFAVVDVTEYALQEIHANVRVVPTMTVHGQAISDSADSFIPEFFWAQPLTGDDWQNESSIFGVQANGFGERTPCTVDDDTPTLAELDIAPWSASTYALYSWIEQRNGSSIPLEVSMTCLLNNLPSECSDLQNVAEVFVLQKAYGYKAQTQETVQTCDAPICAITADKTLLGLRRVHENIPGAPVADRLIPGAGARIEYQFPDTENLQIHIQQAHTTRAYSPCALLLTTSFLSTPYATQQSIVCVGADGAHTVKSELPGTKYCGAFAAFVDSRPVLVVLLGSLNVLHRSLHWQNIIGSSWGGNATESFNSSEVEGSDIFVSSWLSVTVLHNNVTALYVESSTGSVAVGFFSLLWASPTELALENRSPAIVLGDDWRVDMHPWQDFSRIIVSHETVNVLIVSVEIQTSDELSGTVLMLRVCVCSQESAAICSKITLPDVSVLANSSFISAAYMQQAGEEELWIVSVQGKTHTVVVALNTIVLHRVDATDLDNKYFVKVDHLFYCFVTSDSGTALQPSVLTYLPRFQRWRTTTQASLPAVYAIVVVPPGGIQGIATFAFKQDQQNVHESSPVNASSYNASAPQTDTSVLKKILLLQVRWASYSVLAAGRPAQPLYERTADSAAGDALTELLVSPHSINPRAHFPRTLLANYNVTDNNFTLNRALGLPWAYGRYERVVTQNPTQNHTQNHTQNYTLNHAQNHTQNHTQCAFRHYDTVQNTGSHAIALHYRHTTLLGEWLLLLFSVPCGSLLQPFAASSGVCDITHTAESHTLCPDNQRVVVLIHAAGVANTSMHFLEAGTEHTEQLLHSNCIYMQQGVFWIDAVVYAHAPRKQDIHSLLTSIQTSIVSKSAAVSSPGVWRRERHVITVTPRKDMRLELLLERNDVAFGVRVAVGVDDVQLSPILSQFPAVAQLGELCSFVRVPAASELATIGLAHLFRGNHSVSHNDWERLSVTIGLSTAVTQCQFTASLFYALGDGTCTVDPARPQQAHSLHRLGCSLSPASQNVASAYAECQVEIPAFMAGNERLGVAVRPTSNTSCYLADGAEVVVSLRPHTQLYSCASGQFLDVAGACVSCHTNTRFCELGSRLRGCAALEPPAKDNCVLCTEGRELVDSGAAVYVAHDSEPCYWNCSVGFFAFETLGTRTCHTCAQLPQDGCAAGTLWQECSHTHDAACVPCRDLRLSSGPYAANEQFLDIVNKSNTCETQCKQDSYRANDGLCKQCWGRAQLLLHSGVGFFFFQPCTARSNSEARPCVALAGEEIISSDLGEGTLAKPFMSQCVSRCLPGWYAHNNVCTLCTAPRQVVEGIITLTLLPEYAFTWTTNTSTPCAFECKQPYTPTGAAAAVQTCVLCSGICETGSYPSGPYCKCAQCLM